MMGLTLTGLRRPRETDVDRLRALVLTAVRNSAAKVAAAERETAFAWETARHTGEALARAQRRVRQLEDETARQHRLIERLERDLIVARGMPSVQDKLGGAA